MPVIKFVNEKKEIEVPEGANLRAEAKKAGINLNCTISGVSEGIDNAAAKFSKFANCHGFGFCGTCRVNITEGRENTNEMTVREKMKFKYLPIPDPLPCMAFVGNEDKMRLACLTEVRGDMTVETRPKLNLWGENFFS